jgi:hypothetical protein
MQNQKKTHPNEAYLCRIFYLGVRKGDGGTQRGAILIWGYASTKRLRTPALKGLPVVCILSLFANLLYFALLVVFESC